MNRDASATPARTRHFTFDMTIHSAADLAAMKRAGSLVARTIVVQSGAPLILTAA